MKLFTQKDYNTGELNLFTMERKHIIKCLKICKGNKKSAALVMEINERTLFNKIIQHQINDNEYTC